MPRDVSSDIGSKLAGTLPRLRRFALALAGVPAEADDLVQRTCERALRQSGQLRDAARLDAWLYSIMRRLWVDELRSRRGRRHDDLDQATGIVGDTGENSAADRITLMRVRQSLARLPAEQQSVMVLVCVDGLSYREAAEVLGVPIGTVMSRLSRGRCALQSLLATGDAANVVAMPLRPISSKAG